jgi:hypothetical protein
MLKNVVFLNSLVWAVAIFACAVVLKGSDDFLPVLIVLLMGAVGSDAVISRLNPRR